MFDNHGNVNSSISMASYYGSPKVVELLINQGADVNCTDIDGRTPLHWASMQGHLNVVEVLVLHGATVDAQLVTSGYTPLHIAALSKHQNVAEFLLAHGAVLNTETAIILGKINEIKKYIAQGGDVNIQFVGGHTLLSLAVLYGHKDLVEVLIHHGARADAKIGSLRSSLLHLAGALDCDEICEILIDQGIDVNSVDMMGDTPLHKASAVGCYAVVTLLVESGANVNALSNNNRSPIFEAARLHRKEIVRYLLSSGAEVDLVDKLGQPLLLCALQQKEGDEIIQLLITHGANVNVQTPQKLSPLHIAISQKNENIVEMLLSNGAMFT